MLHKLMHNPVMEALRKPCSEDLGKLILRLVVGCAFLSHGWMKVKAGAGIVMFFAKIGIPAAGFFAPFVTWLEVAGGLALILGVAVRLLGLAFAINMVVAILTAKGLSSWKGIELEALLLGASLTLMLGGAGAYSVDGLCKKKMSKEHSNAMPATASTSAAAPRS